MCERYVGVIGVWFSARISLVRYENSYRDLQTSICDVDVDSWCYEDNVGGEKLTCK